MQYSNFDIRIEAIRDGTYTLKAESDTQGEVTDYVDARWIEQNLYAGLQRIESRDTTAEFLSNFGTQLLSALLPEKMHALFQRALGEARSQAKGGVRVRLLIDDATLAEIPWELAYTAVDNHFLAAQFESPFVRYLSIPSYKRSLLSDYPMRMLVVSPRSSGLENAAVEENNLRETIQAMDGRVELVFAHEQSADGKVTLVALKKLLLQQDFHVVHFIGHGHYANNMGTLSLDDGKADENTLAALFSTAHHLSLVVLNSCEGAMGSLQTMLTGTAAALVKKGVPAVIAMRYEVFDSASMVFAQHFYHALFNSHEAGRVDYAMSYARKALVQDFSEHREIATPVLFTHTDESVLFLNARANPINPSVIQTFKAASQQQGALPDPQDAGLLQQLEKENKLIKRKLLIGVSAFRSSIVAACLALFLSWISLLDVFGLETYSEFVTTWLGDQLADSEIHTSLETIALANGPIADKRRELASVLEKLALAKPKVIAIDAFYSVDEGTGEFSKEVDAGHQLSAVMSEVIASGITVVVSPDIKHNRVPKKMLEAGVRSGHNCTQGSMGVFRALPLFIQHKEEISHLAFSAVAARSFIGENLVLKPSEKDVRRPFRVVCSLIDAGLDAPESFIGTRFLRFTPLEQWHQKMLTHHSDTAYSHERFEGKLVLIGYLDQNDTVNTLADTRDGFLWQADAINNLLSNTEIVRLSNGAQFLLMMILGGMAAYARLAYSPSRLRTVALLLVTVLVIWFLCALIYSNVNWVLNPAYLVLAMLIGWWLCGLIKKRLPLLSQ